MERGAKSVDDIVLIGLTVVTVLAYLTMAVLRPQVAVNGLQASFKMLWQALPWIVVSMLVAGLIAQFLDTNLIARWLGREAGLGGIILGALLGTLGTGSRWAMYPLASSMIVAEASPGAVFAFVTTWQLVSVSRLPAELPFYGETFTVVRAIVSVFIAILGGMAVNRVMT